MKNRCLAHIGYKHNINCHINRLRAKIEKTHVKPKFILTIRGVGYKFADAMTIEAA